MVLCHMGETFVNSIIWQNLKDINYKNLDSKASRKHSYDTDHSINSQIKLISFGYTNSREGEIPTG